MTSPGYLKTRINAHVVAVNANFKKSAKMALPSKSPALEEILAISSNNKELQI